VISSSTVIPKNSLTWSLIPRAAVVWIKSKNLWALCTSHMWRVLQRSSNILGIIITLGWPSTLNTPRSSLTKTKPVRDPQQMA
jgi:hypothetical protein